MLDATLLSALLGFHCQLTLTFQSGAQAECSAQIVAPRTLLTAEHCVSNGPDRNPLVIAECGSPEEKRYYIDSIQSPPPRERTDYVRLAFDPTPDTPSFLEDTHPTQAKHLALYFELNGAMKPGTQCFAINRKFRIVSLTTIGTSLRYDRETKSILSTLVSLEQALVPGDSGSPLYCKSPYQLNFELVGVTATVLSPRDSPQYVGNRFTTFFP